jgi:hypothetical protein
VSVFRVIPRLFKASSLRVNWSDAGVRIAPLPPDPAPVALRWMLHPSLGLPRRPFLVSVLQGASPSATAADLANDPGWEDVELVGLPYDEWPARLYDGAEQGMLAAGLTSPVEAARRRMLDGAPRIGWRSVSMPSGATLDPWVWAPDDAAAWVEDLGDGSILSGVRAMLEQVDDPAGHAAYAVKETDASALMPQTLVDPAAPGTTPSAMGEWHPLGLMLLAAGSDPYASLAFGFGTAVGWNIELDESTRFRIAVEHTFAVGKRPIEGWLCDVVDVRWHAAPQAPAGLAVRTSARTPPQRTDGLAVDANELSWARGANPIYAGQDPMTPRASSYALARLDGDGRANVLLAPRAGTDSWLPFAASNPSEAGAVRFVDHLERRVDGEPWPWATTHRYAVAAQDLFGQFSAWSAVDFEGADEPLQTPSVRAVSLGEEGNVALDIGWDWSARSPQFVELRGTFEDEPGSAVFSVRLEYGGESEPSVAGATGTTAVPLTHELEQKGGWGADQDAGEPGLRYCRVFVALGAIEYDASGERVLAVVARGQSHVAETTSGGQGIGPWSPPRRAKVVDPGKPAGPAIAVDLEVPQWASLPDVTGVSRATLSWGAVPGALGYIVYEASETAVLGATPDRTSPFSGRLVEVRSVVVGAHGTFKRLNATPVAGTSYQVVLPRGSTVIHVYAVRALGANNQLSPWPTSSDQFFAVAAPRQPVLAAPVLSAELGEADPTVAHLSITLPAGEPVEHVEIYRLTNDAAPASADAMGPPVATVSAVDGVAKWTDDAPPLGWQPVWYRAISWSKRDDQRGVTQTRSASSTPVSVFKAPEPWLFGFAGQELAGCHLAIVTPHIAVARTPFGPQRGVVEITHVDPATQSETQLGRAESNLDELALYADAQQLPLSSAPVGLARLGVAGSEQIVAWVRIASFPSADRMHVKLVDPLGRSRDAWQGLAGAG